MNVHHAPVSSPVRQELWLTFNRGPLSEHLRWHHSQVLDLARSDPATYNCIDLSLTDNDCTEMQNQMRSRLQEVEQRFQNSSNVKWGAKLRNYAKWEYLKDEIVLLYRWLKQQTTHGRGMNTVRGEMSRRYGDLFKFRLGISIDFQIFRKANLDRYTILHDRLAQAAAACLIKGSLNRHESVPPDRTEDTPFLRYLHRFSRSNRPIPENT